MIRKLRFIWFGWFLSMSICGDGGVGFYLSIFLSEHGSETCQGKRPEPRAMLCLLEYDCGANALGSDIYSSPVQMAGFRRFALIYNLFFVGV